MRFFCHVVAHAVRCSQGTRAVDPDIRKIASPPVLIEELYRELHHGVGVIIPYPGKGFFGQQKDHLQERLADQRQDRVDIEAALFASLPLVLLEERDIAFQDLGDREPGPFPIVIGEQEGIGKEVFQPLPVGLLKIVFSGFGKGRVEVGAYPSDEAVIRVEVLPGEGGPKRDPGRFQKPGQGFVLCDCLMVAYGCRGLQGIEIFEDIVLCHRHAVDSELAIVA
jgi:hypothetical protein